MDMTVSKQNKKRKEDSCGVGIIVLCWHRCATVIVVSEQM